MKNYAPWAIVPVGTKVVRTTQNIILEVWKVYTVVKNTADWIIIKWYEVHWEFNIVNFAPYEEEEDTKIIPVYVTLKDMPYISKGSVIIQRTDWTVVNQANDNYSNNPSNYIIDDLNWLLKEHPEDFKKIN